MHKMSITFLVVPVKIIALKIEMSVEEIKQYMMTMEITETIEKFGEFLRFFWILILEEMYL